MPFKSLVTLFILCCSFAASDENRKEKICSNIDVRNNVSYLQKLNNCTTVEGYVRIVLLDKMTEADFSNITFPDLREITQYLLLYRVNGLRSVGKLFPNLALIRGTDLLAGASLIIYSNEKLQDIGLHSLTHIMEGSIVINRNPNLCYVKSVNWNSIMKLDANNRTYYELFLQGNKFGCEDKCEGEQCAGGHCWSKMRCQKTRLDLAQCHELCAGGCYKQNSPYDCHVCSGVLTEDKKCVEKCPDGSFEFLSRTCVTKEVCHSTPIVKKGSPPSEFYFTFGGICGDKCPSRFKKVGITCVACKEGSNHEDCFKECFPGMNLGDTNTAYKINGVSSAKKLQSCTRIRGTLEIEIKTGTYFEGIERALEVYLGMIEEIDGQLKVVHSPALTSLNFLRDLKVIHGEDLEETNVTEPTLVIKNNNNLKQLWDWNKRPFGLKLEKNGLSRKRIINGEEVAERMGTVMFHFNPKLCITEIDNLREVANVNYGDLEVSRQSNGWEMSCNRIVLNVTVRKRNSNSVVLAMHDPDYAGRFIVYYRETDLSNVRRLNESESVLPYRISECDSRWKTREVMATPNESIIMAQLEPDTEYMYFVKTYTTHEYMGTSPIQYVTTLPAQPTKPKNLVLNSSTDSSLTLSWQPPSHPHGKLAYYVLKGYAQSDTIWDLSDRDYCREEDMVGEYGEYYKPIISSDIDDDNGDDGRRKSPAWNTYAVVPSPNGNVGCNCNNGKIVTGNAKPDYCRDFEHKNEFTAKDFEKVDLLTCDSLFENIVEANFLKLHVASTEEFPEHFPANETLATVNEPQSDMVIISSNVTDTDGRFVAFTTRSDAPITTIEVGNLRHFSQYVVFVSVCRESHPEEPARTAKCSQDAFVTVRTKKSKVADAIPNVDVRVNNQTAIAKWTEPTLVNSFIHSYVVEYKRDDVEYSTFYKECIPAKTFLLKNGTHEIKGLSPGRYIFQARAISLAGEGPPSTAKFTIRSLANANEWTKIWGFAVILLVMILSLASAYAYYWRMSVARNRILVASVNPRYEPVYVEDHWEIARERLTLVRQLGRGTFGSVHEGLLKPDGVRVAVKTTMGMDEEDNSTFLKEATLMKEFQNAFHVVSLIGVISKGDPVYVIMELMEKGDLKSFLLQSGPDLCDENGRLPDGMLTRMTAEIADGMAFLEGKKFVHRDLAARNCMVSEDLTIKIGDFGLARDIYETDYYRKGERATLPIRWMAPESIRDGIFTSLSDIWSYGIVLWEIATLAQSPYHPLTNEEVIRFVQSGKTLQPPQDFNPILKSIMKACWSWHASRRPKFTHILKILDEHTREEFRLHSYYHNGEFPGEAQNVIPCQQEIHSHIIQESEDGDEVTFHFGTPPSKTGGGTLGPPSNPNVHYHRNVSTIRRERK